MSEVNDLTARIGATVAAARRERRESLGELARAAGLSKALLSRLERGEGNPSVETLFKLSQALGVSPGVLIGEPRAPRTRLVRAGEGAAAGDDGALAAWMLHADPRGRRGELFDLRFAAGTDQSRAAHLPATEELLVCTAGELEVGPRDAPERLGPGDALWFRADVAHVYRAPDGARALCWMLYDPVVGAGGGRP